MALTNQLPIYKVAYDLLDSVTDSVRNHRATLANILRYRGHCIKADFTKTYRRPV